MHHLIKDAIPTNNRAKAKTNKASGTSHVFFTYDLEWFRDSSE